MTFTGASGAAAMSSHSKGEGSESEKALEPAEFRPTEIRQGSAKASRPRGSGKGHSLRR